MKYLYNALQLAKIVEHQTSTNPAVGCVIVNNGKIVGMGAHLIKGEHHAEVHALKQAGLSASGATLFVTLEPCSHHGKTPPCTQAIIDGGVKEVIYAHRDPNSLVHGHHVLEEENIKTTHMPLAEIESFYHQFDITISKQRPYITIKTAMSIDGKMHLDNFDSSWITSDSSRKDVHQLRHQYNAIAVGANTYHYDKPRLNARLDDYGQQPLPIIFTNQPRDILNDQHQHAILVGQYGLNPTTALNDLYNQGISSILIEGGPTLINQLLTQRLFDELIVYIAPKLLGSRHTIYENPHITSMEDIQHLTLFSTEQFESDIKLTYRNEVEPCSLDLSNPQD